MNILHKTKILSKKFLKKREINVKISEYAKKLESILIFVMEIIFPNKNQFLEKLNLQTGANANALPLNELNLKNTEKNDNLFILRSFFEKLMEQPKQIEVPKMVKKTESSALNNCLMIANKNQYFENKNNLNSSNMSVQSSNNSQVSQLVNNIVEGLDNKREMPNPLLEEISIFGNQNENCNFPYISRVDCTI